MLSMLLLASCLPTLPSASTSSAASFSETSHTSEGSLISSQLPSEGSSSSASSEIVLTSSSSESTSSDTSISESSSVPSSETPLIETTLIANPPSGESFWYWQDTQTQKIFSLQPTVTALLPSPHRIMPIYRRLPTQTYSTGFETLKSSYVRGAVTFDGQVWILEDGHTNMVAGDKREGTRSVRLHGGGYMQTDFTLNDVATISFKHTVYTTDESKVNVNNPVKLALQFSQTRHRWTTLDDGIIPLVSWSTYSYTFDGLSLYLAEQWQPSLPTYFRIVNLNQQSSTDGIRVNIDTLAVTTYANHPDYPLLTHQTNRIQFIYSDPMPSVIALGQTLSLPTCVAKDTVTQANQTCTVTNHVNAQTTGQYQVTFTTTDPWGATIEDRYPITVLPSLTHLSVDYTGYYDGIEGLYGDALVRVLREKSYASIIRKSYLDAKTSLALADVNPNVSGQAIAIYTGNSLPSVWDGGSTWLREHVWPNSRLGTRGVSDSDLNIASDLHNLRFIEAGVNQSRSNKGYDGITTSTTYFPGPDRGDVARIYFYMAMHYDHLVITDTLPTTGEYIFTFAQSGIRSYLLSMHEEDQVSSFETARHQFIKQHQGNPNPFIDFPYLASLAYL